MSKDELIIQLVKVALGILIGGYFLWWSLEMLKQASQPSSLDGPVQSVSRDWRCQRVVSPL